MQMSFLGWNQRFAAAFTAHASAGLVPGRVIQQFNHLYTVATEWGEMRAQLSGRLRYEVARDQLPVTGDWVALRVPSNQSSPNQDAAQIQAVLPRATRFSRRAAGKSDHEQVVAANLDYAFLITGLDNDFSPRRIERYLTAAWESGATPVVVLNKLDLCADPASRIHAVESVALGTAIHAVSALCGDGIQELARYCVPGQTVAMLGRRWQIDTDQPPRGKREPEHAPGAGRWPGTAYDHPPRTPVLRWRRHGDRYAGNA
jgi:ribosome biogenesis GTPase / thiamine phosphate phosphatase